MKYPNANTLKIGDPIYLINPYDNTVDQYSIYHYYYLYDPNVTYFRVPNQPDFAISNHKSNNTTWFTTKEEALNHLITLRQDRIQNETIKLNHAQNLLNQHIASIKTANQLER